MSTFDGRIKEYPELAIDSFIPNNYAQFFLLSHVHKDHTRGLENEEFNKTLYCSKQTARMLPLMETRASKQLMYAHLKDRLKAIPYYEPTYVEIKNEVIKFTFYPANHCPGASLILIEGDRGTVLYTGDMRAEPEFVLNNLNCLKNFRIKNLYMDTTCCYNERRTFISKNESALLLVDLVKAYPDHFHMYLDTWTPGYEEMWIIIKEKFNKKIHVSQQRYDMYVHLEEMYKEVLTTDPTSTRFHSCRWDEGCFKHEARTVSIHPVLNRNEKAFDFKPSKHSRLLQSDLPRHCKPYQQMILPFSTHSSLSEIIFFYKFIKPKKFTPCVAHGGWKTQYEMFELLRNEGCIVSDTPSSSEIERGNQTTSCSSNDVSSGPTRTMTDDESTNRSSINYISTAEDTSIKSATSVASKSCTTSQPLSEKSTNALEKQTDGAISTQKSCPSLKVTNVPKKPTNGDVSTKKSSPSLKVKRSLSRSTNHTLSQKSSLHENENRRPRQHISASLPINPSTVRPSSTIKHSLTLSHSSCTSSEKMKENGITQGLKRTQSNKSLSFFVDQNNEVTGSLGPNITVLSVPSTLNHIITHTPSRNQVDVQFEQAQVESDSDDNDPLNAFSISRKSTQRFINSFVAMRKKRRRKCGESKNNPITL